MQIRNADERDDEAIAELFSAADDARVLSGDGQTYERQSQPERARSVVLVVEAEDAVVAFGAAALNPSTTIEGAARAFVTVDEDYRRKGIGDLLGRRLLEHLREVGAKRVTSFFRWTEEGDRWATTRGWSRLTTQPLNAVDPRTVLEPSIPTGYRCVPMGAVAPEKVYAAVRMAALDEPTPIPSDDFRLDDFLREWKEPDADLESSTAVLDDQGSVVAFTRLKVNGDRAQQGFTGTVREHRGRGLATAAKCSALRRAAARGVTRVTASNTEENAAMRAINHKLGFDRIGEHVIFGRISNTSQRAYDSYHRIAGGSPRTPLQLSSITPRSRTRLGSRNREGRRWTMAKARVGINGFGRIGRNFLRAHLARRGDCEVVLVNDLTAPEILAHLLRYDSSHGRLEGVGVDGDRISVDGTSFQVLAERDPKALPWGDLGIEVVVESTGLFTARDSAQQHLEAGAKKVLVSAPATDPDITIVLGVNDEKYDRDNHHIVSMASCTTGSVAPMAKLLLDNFGLETGFMTTIHAYTTEQQLQDQVSLTRKGKPDLRRMRSAAVNIVPASTGAARAIGEVIPELKGKLDGLALRVPVPDGSVTDLVVNLEREASGEEINEMFRSAAASDHWREVLEYTEDAIVSSDIIGNSHSCIVDGLSTMAHGRQVKVIGWYDNEWGYSCRLVDLIPRLL